MNKELWEKSESKRLLNLGLEHIKKGKTVPARKMGLGCSVKCRLKCSSRISREIRETCFENFWKIGDIDHQRLYLHKRMQRSDKKCQRVNSKRERTSNFFYFLMDSTNEESRVCKATFLDTFGKLTYNIIFILNGILNYYT